MNSKSRMIRIGTVVGVVMEAVLFLIAIRTSVWPLCPSAHCRKSILFWLFLMASINPVWVLQWWSMRNKYLQWFCKIWDHFSTKWYCKKNASQRWDPNYTFRGFALHLGTECMCYENMVQSNGIFPKYFHWIHCLLCKRQRWYHCTTQTRVAERILKLNPIHVQWLIGFCWIYWIGWKFCSI